VVIRAGERGGSGFLPPEACPPRQEGQGKNAESALRAKKMKQPMYCQQKQLAKNSRRRSGKRYGGKKKTTRPGNPAIKGHLTLKDGMLKPSTPSATAKGERALKKNNNPEDLKRDAGQRKRGGGKVVTK